DGIPLRAVDACARAHDHAPVALVAIGGAIGELGASLRGEQIDSAQCRCDLVFDDANDLAGMRTRHGIEAETFEPVRRSQARHDDVAMLPAHPRRAKSPAKRATYGRRLDVLDPHFHLDLLRWREW